METVAGPLPAESRFGRELELALYCTALLSFALSQSGEVAWVEPDEASREIAVGWQGRRFCLTVGVREVSGR